MSSTHLKVLLVEDNPGDARLIREMLLEVPHLRFELELADRLATGLVRLRAGDIHAVLLDLGLPDSRGHDTFVAAQAEASHVPIIVLTGLGDEALALRTVQEGAQDYLVKGQVDARLLERAIRYAVERKKAEQALRLSEMALRQSEASFRSLVLNSPYAIFRSSLDGRFLDANPALVGMLGYGSDSELMTLYCPADVYGDPRESEQLVEFFKSQTQFRGIEVGWKRKDGKLITVNLTGRPVRDEEGTLTHFEIIAEDITERKALEAQLRQLHRMESVGRLAGGVAHDFNNLLCVMLGHSEVLQDSLDQNNGLRKHAEEITKAGKRAASLTRQLLAYSRQQLLEPKVLSLNTVVADMESMIQRLIGEDIELATVLEPSLGRVKADQGQIEQIIMNLAVNARDAMPQGGKLIMETSNVELDEAFAHQHPPSTPGRYILLVVTDTGLGISKKIQAHIFEPFFTTKGKDKGTGLGLSVVYGVVKQSGGYIWVYSEPGKGTTFKIYLPRVEEAVEKDSRSAGSSDSLQGSETILLVEDEESLRLLARGLLTQGGYTVLDTSDGTQALEITNEHQGTIHLLLTDVVLPGMSGLELAEKMTLLRPDMKVLFMSGYTNYGVAAHGVLEAGTFLLQKPFTRDALTGKVREVLDTKVAVKV
jgi:two-component system, cell cycle sensor histidine kinase and response regulator CckA